MHFAAWRLWGNHPSALECTGGPSFSKLDQKTDEGQRIDAVVGVRKNKFEDDYRDSLGSDQIYSAAKTPDRRGPDARSCYSVAQQIGTSSC